MLDFVFVLISIAMGGGSGGEPTTDAAQAASAAPETAGLVAEDQTPSGKFTTATEIKPILTATKGNWIAVREWEGQDLIYVTHIWSWRCGLVQMEVSINGNAPEIWPLPPCHLDYAQPNAVLETDGLPYRPYRLKSVENIEVTVTYDDLTSDSATFERGSVLIP